MDPLTISAIIATVVAAAGSAYAQYEQAQYQSEVAGYNRKIATQQADLARQNAAVEEAQVRERGERIMAANRARLGASGVAFEGSPLLAMMDSAAELEYEALLARAGGGQRAQSLESEARLLRFQQGGIKRAGYIGAGTTLLAGAAQAYGASRYGSAKTTTGYQPTYGGATY